MAEKVKVGKLRRFNPSMKVPGNGSVEIPMNMDMTQRGGRRNAREFANAMNGFGGRAESVDHQYTDKGAQGEGDGF